MDGCDVCGDPEISWYWSNFWFQYCSFSCRAYAFRYATFFSSFVILILVLASIIPIYWIIGVLIFFFDSPYGFTRTIDKSILQSNPDYINMTSDEIQADKFKDFKCRKCGSSLTLGDMNCPKCGYSTHEVRMKYFTG